MFCSFMLKTQKWLVDIAQEKRFNDISATISMLLTFKSFLILLRQSTEFLNISAILLFVSYKPVSHKTTSRFTANFHIT